MNHINLIPPLVMTMLILATHGNLNLECGMSDVKFNPRSPKIINGTCTPQRAFPWIAQLQIRDEGQFVHHCGGTLIAQNIVLTAAHCLQSSGELRIGLVSSSSSGPRTYFQVQNYASHPLWDSFKTGRFSNDIALVKFNSSGAHDLVPACLPKRAPSSGSSQCIISGWGLTGEEEWSEECLRSAHVGIFDFQECQNFYKPIGKRLYKGMMCAGNKDGGIDSCKGDSGGPLFCPFDQDRYSVEGIVSWGHGCGIKGKPGVYTIVGDYLNWIKQRMQTL